MEGSRARVHVWLANLLLIFGTWELDKVWLFLHFLLPLLISCSVVSFKARASVRHPGLLKSPYVALLTELLGLAMHVNLRSSCLSCLSSGGRRLLPFSVSEEPSRLADLLAPGCRGGPRTLLRRQLSFTASHVAIEKATDDPTHLTLLLTPPTRWDCSDTFSLSYARDCRATTVTSSVPDFSAPHMWLVEQFMTSLPTPHAWGLFRSALSSSIP